MVSCPALDVLLDVTWGRIPGSVRYGASGTPKTRAPAKIPRHSPLTSPGLGVFSPSTAPTPGQGLTPPMSQTGPHEMLVVKNGGLSRKWVGLGLDRGGVGRSKKIDPPGPCNGGPLRAKPAPPRPITITNLR